MEIEQTIDAFLDGDYKLPTRLYSGKEIENWQYYENIKTGEKVNENKFSEYVAGAPWEPVTKPYFNGWASAVSFSVMKDGKPYHIGWISGITDELKKADALAHSEEFVPERLASIENAKSQIEKEQMRLGYRETIAPESQEDDKFLLLAVLCNNSKDFVFKCRNSNPSSFLVGISTSGGILGIFQHC